MNPTFFQQTALLCMDKISKEASDEANTHLTANPTLVSDSQQLCDSKAKTFIVEQADSHTKTLSLSGSPPPIRKCIEHHEQSRAVAPIIARVNPPASVQLPINHYYGPYHNALHIDLGIKDCVKKLNVGTLIWKQVQNYARKVLRINCNIFPILWPAPTPNGATDYNMGHSLRVRPLYDPLRIDWSSPGITRWTSDAAVLFSLRFCAEYQKGGFPTIPVQPIPAKIASMFTKFVLRMKAFYAKELAQFNQSDSLDSPTDEEV